MRCNATSNYSNVQVITNTRVITVGQLSVPAVGLFSPVNNSYINTDAINFTFVVSSNRNFTNCSLYINGTLNKTNTSVASDVTTTLNVSGFNEGRYNWGVSCIDVNNTVGNSSTYIFTVDRGPPNITLNAPVNNSNFTTDSIVFNWTTADTTSGILRCNVTIDGTVQATNVNSTSSVPANTTITGLTVGLHTWNVTCADDAGNINTSVTWTFNITNLPPNVTLLSPANGTWNSSSTILFFYNVTDRANQTPRNCSLYINSELNQTNATSINLGQSNNFSVTTLGEGYFPWYVVCVDPDGVENASQTRTVIIDRSVPYINLTNPPNSNG